MSDRPTSRARFLVAVLLCACAAPSTPRADGGPAPDGSAPPVVAADGSTPRATLPDAGCASAEACDGLDDDCDGRIDEGLDRACTDLCGTTGRQACTDGAWQLCEPVAPVAEACDGLDDDCDGLVDEELACPAEKPRLTVWILAGQSNMVGLGINRELSSADAASVPRAHIYYNDSIHPNPDAMRWTGLRPGFGVLADRFGPELSFGRRMRELWPGHTVAILKVAEGATALSDRWAAGSGDLYQLLLREIRDQMRDLHVEWRPQIAGFVWMQGESDAISRSDASAYGARLRAMLERLRADLEMPVLPVTAGLIVEQDLWPHADLVRGATSRLADELGPMSAVETTDLRTHPSDPAHYDSASTLTLGRRFADAMSALYGTAWDFPGDLTTAQGDGFWRYQERPILGDAAALRYEPSSRGWRGAECVVSADRVQPGATRAAEITWTAPLAGRFEVTVSATDRGDAGSDGEQIEITDGERVFFGPASLRAGRTARHSFTIDLEQGRELVFRTSSGLRRDARGDAVAWRIDVDAVAFDE